MTGTDLRNLEILHAGERADDLFGGRLVLFFAFWPGGLLWLGSVQGMGIKYSLPALFWTCAACSDLTSPGWYGICWLGGMVSFLLSWKSWRSKTRASA